MKTNVRGALATLLFVVVAAGCGAVTSGGSSDRNRLSTEDLASVDVSTLHEAVQRLRPRWLEVRSPRGLGTETRIAVFLDRTYIGDPEELRGLGLDVAEWLEYRSGTEVVGDLTVPGTAHVEGAIIIHTGGRGDA